MSQYIQITREVCFNECSGRQTLLQKGTFGFVLDKEGIQSLHGASREMKAYLEACRIEAGKEENIYALVAGYPCKLSNKDCRILDSFLDKTPLHCIAELI